MKKLKLHIIANNAKWSTYMEKCGAIKRFFASVLDLSIEIEYTKYEIPLVVSKNFAPLYVVADEWYDNRVSRRDADIVMLVVPPEDRKGVVTPMGIMTGKDVGAWEITMFCNENDHAYIGGKDFGNSFELYACHEISHVLYAMLNKEDKTHEYFYSGQPNKVLADFLFPQMTVEEQQLSIFEKIVKLMSEYVAQLMRQKAETTHMIVDMQPADIPARMALYEVAVAALGRDASPKDKAPDDLACAESVNDLHTEAYGIPIGGDVSTYRLNQALAVSKYHIRIDVKDAAPGDIIIAATGTGNGTIKHGHVGIVGKNGVVMSNDSPTGQFKENLTVERFLSYWGVKGGYPVHVYRVEKKPVK